MLQLNGHLVDTGVFPNGENYLIVNENMMNMVNTIELNYENDSDLIHLHFLVTHIRNTYAKTRSILSLKIPYLPYSRMDRPMLGRTFTLKSVAEFINSLEFDEVEIWEPHSDVSVALINNVTVRNITINALLPRVIQDILHISIPINKIFKVLKDNNIYIVFPDNGAEKRYSQQISELDPDFHNMKACSKIRDLATGRIKEFRIADPSPDDKIKVAIIVDDLCSKGGTFIACAQALRKQYPSIEGICLAVTHCEHSIIQGDLLKTDAIQGIWTTNSMILPDDLRDVPKMHILDKEQPVYMNKGANK